MYKKIQITYVAAFCDVCKEDLHSYDGWPYVEADGNQYCEECALKVGVLPPLEWVKRHNAIARDYYTAEMKNGEIYAYYKCKTKKGYRIDRWGPVFDEKL